MSDLIQHVYGGLCIALPEHLKHVRAWDGTVVSLDEDNWQAGRRVMVLRVTAQEKLMPSLLRRATLFIDRERHHGRRVVVYSRDDVGYAALIVMAYLIEYLDMNLPDAYTMLINRLSLFNPPRDRLWNLVETYSLPFEREDVLFNNTLTNKLWEQSSKAIHHITRGIYLSGIDAMWNPYKAREIGISAVVRVDNADRQMGNWSASFEVLDLPLIDGSYLDSENITTVTQFIHQQIERGNKVLIHCHAGVSRSATMVLAYLIEYGGLDFEQAFALLVHKRPLAYPHWALLKSLVRHYNLPYDEDAIAQGHFLDHLGIEKKRE